MEVMAKRALWAGVLFVLVVYAVRWWWRVRTFTAQTREMRILMFCAMLVGLNRSAYLYAIFTDRITQSALSYFIYPLPVIAMGILVSKEPLSRRTMTALLLAFTGVLNKASAVGSIPWLALFMRATFATYDLIRKQMRGTDALSSTVIEMFLLAPFAFGYISFLVLKGHSFFFDEGMTGILHGVSSGIVTATPLFAVPYWQ